MHKVATRSGNVAIVLPRKEINIDEPLMVSVFLNLVSTLENELWLGVLQTIPHLLPPAALARRYYYSPSPFHGGGCGGFVREAELSPERTACRTPDLRRESHFLL